ncbi:MAG TPA: tetratricopeptide repeat protein [Lysobacter sp.]
MRNAWVAVVMALALQAGLACAQPAPGELMTLPVELRQRLHAEVLDGRHGAQQKLDRLGRFMFEPEGLGMTYQEDANHSVAQAYATRTANCLTFTLLFVALAREAGLDAAPQEIEDTLAWRQDDGTLYLSNHVNAVVRIGSRRYIVDVAGDNVIARDPPAPISDERLMSHYYNNLAVQRLAQGDYPGGLAMADAALRLDPLYATHWSNAGVLHVRNGDLPAAQRAYARALALDPRNANALFNVASLAQRMGDRSREMEYRQRLAKVQQDDPFHQFLLAANYERTGDLARAIRHYRRAISLHGEEHRFHSALANAYLQAGDVRRAARSLARAQALSDGDTRAAYRDRLDQLRRQAR